MTPDPARPTRPYRQVARAERAAATAERILDATVALFWEEPALPPPLAKVAERSGTTVQTVIRRFGGRDGLVEAAIAREAARIAAVRSTIDADGPAGAVCRLVDHYEADGDAVIRLLAEESRSTAVAPVVAQGRRVHRDWCTAVFGDALGRTAPVDRPRRLAQIMTVCDVYTWKLLRRDQGLDRAATELAILELLRPLLEEPRWRASSPTPRPPGATCTRSRP